MKRGRRKRDKRRSRRDRAIREVFAPLGNYFCVVFSEEIEAVRREANNRPVRANNGGLSVKAIDADPSKTSTLDFADPPTKIIVCNPKEGWA
ncbi:MAG TPA: hypothetical protein PKL84_18145 [Candidatus Hydrogenedentes bacterium]|nr:hypothetical protein [Candidatus Hydrogenedentota bacterium]